MNILLTSTGNLDDRDHKYLMKTCRDYHHIVETLPLDRLLDYLRVDPGSKWAAVDAIAIRGSYIGSDFNTAHYREISDLTSPGFGIRC